MRSGDSFDTPVSVTGGDDSETRRFEIKGGARAINYPVYLGTQGMAEKFGVKEEYPLSFLISRDGRQVKRIVGPV